jgi:hypothetical protein
MEIGQRTGEVVDGAQEQVLDSSRGCLDRGGCQRRLPMCGKQHTVDTRSLGAAKERANVLGILERIEREHQGCLTALDRPREHVIECCVAAWGRHHGDALVAVEAGERGEGAALDLDDRNPQVRCMQDQPLQRLAPLRDDDQAFCLATRDECFLDGSPTRDDLLVRRKETAQIRRWRFDSTPGRVPW